MGLFTRKQQGPTAVTVRDILRGLEAGRLQSVGIMQVIPLLGDMADDRFATLRDVRVGTVGYGAIRFENPGDGYLIVPCHAAVSVKQGAQDHAMASARIVKRRSQQTFAGNMCIQQTQPGLIQDGTHRLLVLPMALRERALEKRESSELGRLWQDIGRFNKRFGLPPQGDLVRFLDRFAKELDEFVAEFECVPRQLGAIILVGGHVVGIERAPNHAYWLSVWDALIRECYGSLAIEQRLRDGDDAPVPATRVDLPPVSTVDELREALKWARSEEDRRVKAVIRDLLDDPFTLTPADRVEDFRIETVAHEQFVGQVVREGARVHYASLVTTEHWQRHGVWESAGEFSV